MHTISQLVDQKLIAIIRGYRVMDALKIGSELNRNGVKLMEVTLNSPYPYSSINKLVTHLGTNATIGAGTVLTVDQVNKAHEAGAKFIVSPNTDRLVIQRTRELGLVSLPGAMTPTEVVNAHNFGADLVKIFPASMGLGYFKTLRAVLGHIPMLPTGGITLTNLKEYWRAGAIGFGIGDALVPAGKELSDDLLSTVGERSRDFVALIKTLK